MRLRRQIKLALLAALPIEAATLCCSGMVLDPGNSPDNMPWYLYGIGFVWSLVHGPALILLDWIERGFPLHPAAPGVLMPQPPGTPVPHPGLSLPTWAQGTIFVGGGYLTTALLLFGVGFVIQRLLRWRRGGPEGTELVVIRL